jgi:ABC-type glycerol-3-phosphate transport system permease component
VVTYLVDSTAVTVEAVPRELEEAALVDGRTTFLALPCLLLFLLLQRHYVRGFMTGALRG